MGNPEAYHIDPELMKALAELDTETYKLNESVNDAIASADTHFYDLNEDKHLYHSVKACIDDEEPTIHKEIIDTGRKSELLQELADALETIQNAITELQELEGEI